MDQKIVFNYIAAVSIQVSQYCVISIISILKKYVQQLKF